MSFVSIVGDGALYRQRPKRVHGESKRKTTWRLRYHEKQRRKIKPPTYKKKKKPKRRRVRVVKKPNTVKNSIASRIRDLETLVRKLNSAKPQIVINNNNGSNSRQPRTIPAKMSVSRIALPRKLRGYTPTSRNIRQQAPGGVYGNPYHYKPQVPAVIIKPDKARDAGLMRIVDKIYPEPAESSSKIKGNPRDHGFIVLGDGEPNKDEDIAPSLEQAVRDADTRMGNDNDSSNWTFRGFVSNIFGDSDDEKKHPTSEDIKSLISDFDASSKRAWATKVNKFFDTHGIRKVMHEGKLVKIRSGGASYGDKYNKLVELLDEMGGSGVADMPGGLMENDINNIMKDFIKYGYQGTLANDELNQLKRRGDVVCCIFNTTKREEGGQHWLALWIDSLRQQCCVYDPLADKIPQASLALISNFVNDNYRHMLKYKFNKIRQQGLSSELCGFYSMDFLRKMYESDGDFKYTTRFNGIKKGERDLAKRFGYI